MGCLFVLITDNHKRNRTPPFVLRRSIWVKIVDDGRRSAPHSWPDWKACVSAPFQAYSGGEDLTVRINVGGMSDWMEYNMPHPSTVN